MSALALLLLPLALAPAQDPDARLRRGMELWRSGEIEAAADEFRAANDARPADPLGAFDRGVAALQLAQLGEARTAFLSAALAPDPALAAKARYHLGLVAAAEARAALGEEPEALAPEARDAVRAQLGEAGRAFADSLALDPGLEAARHNLEVLRERAHELETEWEAADHAALRAQSDPFAWIAHLRNSQDALRGTAEERAVALPSPRWAEALREDAAAHLRLASDARHLSEKLRAAYGGTEGLPAEQLEALMENWRAANEAAATAMEQAAARLRALDPAGAGEAQRGAAREIEQLFRGLAPFEALLQSGIEVETALLEGSAAEAPLPPGRLERFAERQRDVELWCGLLALHAQQGLAQLPPPAPPEEAEAGEEATPADESPEEQRRAMFERAIELAPKAHEAATAAAEALAAGDAEAARPHLERTKELLEEIAPKQPQKGDGEDQKSGEQDPQQEQEPQDPGQDQEQEQPQDPQEDGEAEAPPEQETRPLTGEELEKLLERAQEREQDYKDFLKELERRRAERSGRVERDW